MPFILLLQQCQASLCRIFMGLHTSFIPDKTTEIDLSSSSLSQLLIRSEMDKEQGKDKHCVFYKGY